MRSTVDGYAVRAADTYGATAGMPAYLDVIGEAPMGALTEIQVGMGQAVLVHTGGMVPAGADAVIMLEYTSKAGDAPLASSPNIQSGFHAYSLEVQRPVANGENCIQVGEDVRAGEPILAGGHTLRPQDLGALLALGILEVQVARQPRVAILSQGDEVVPPEQEPGPGQVRDINSYTLAGFVRQAGGIPLTYPIIPDRQAALDTAAHAAFADADIVVLTAGSSVSYRDLTANTIEGLGEPGILVHGVAVRPGKPTILAICDGKPVFGLPGNPVSCIKYFSALRDADDPAIAWGAAATVAPCSSPIGTQHAGSQRPGRFCAGAAGGTGWRDVGRAGVRQIQPDLHAGALGWGCGCAVEQQRHTGRVDSRRDARLKFGIAQAYSS